MKRSVILIIHDDRELRNVLKKSLSGAGFDLLEAPNIINLSPNFARESPELIIIGSSKRDTFSGLRVARRIRQVNSKIPIIFLTEESSEDLAIEALRTGITDYFKFPLSSIELTKSIKLNLAKASSDRPLPFSKASLDALPDNQTMVGACKKMQDIKKYILKVAASDSNVLITGETGTGKELAADMIHRHSMRSQKHFICVNCAAIPDSLVESELFGYKRGAFTGAHATRQGFFEQAEGGSIFLDEISDMSPHAQAKILRVIESKKVTRVGGRREKNLDVRIIAATNQEPEQLVRKGVFRKDLYYRLNIARINMLPLRKRREDIPGLLEYFVRDLNQRSGRNVHEFSEKAWVSLLHYDWPGNVRELKNLLESTFITINTDRISYRDLPSMFQMQFEKMNRPYACERERLVSALYMTNWNKSKAAEKLNWSRMTLYRKIEKYHIVESRSVRTWAGRECNIIAQ